LFACAMMKSISSLVAPTSSAVPSTGTSVVPITTLPCHGMMKSTRPSSVLGISIASPPRNVSAAKTTCDPRLCESSGPTPGLVERTQFVHEDPGRVDDDFRARLDLRAGLLIAHERAARAIVRIQEAHGARVVRDDGAPIDRRACDREREPRIVELAVEIAHAAVQVRAPQIRHPAQRRERPERPAEPEVRKAREQIVGRKPAKNSGPS
jgi:hypothetical protein